MPTNRLAILSLSSALITLMFFCIGVLPIPFTDLISYSASGLFALIALVTGIIAIIQIRLRHEGGAIQAWIGVIVGFVTLLAALCFIALALALLPLVVSWLEQIWKQVHPSSFVPFLARLRGTEGHASGRG